MKYQGLTVDQYNRINKMSKEKNIPVDEIVDEIIDLVNYELCDTTEEAINEYELAY